MSPAGVTTHRARRRFAQHFLVQAGAAERIVALADIGVDDTVLEIGPGRGALTRRLAAITTDLRMVEIDRDLATRLAEEFAGHDGVTVVTGDILVLDLGQVLAGARSTVAVANLPYNISTPVLAALLEHPRRFRRLVLMLQREVAERVISSPGKKTYGALSVMVQLVARTRIAFTLPPGAFRPRPKVDSAVIVVDPLDPLPLPPSQVAGVRRVVRTAFTRRRKQLANAIAALTDAPRDVLARAGIDPRRRPETLEVDEFVAVAQALEAL